MAEEKLIVAGEEDTEVVGEEEEEEAEVLEAEEDKIFVEVGEVGPGTMMDLMIKETNHL